MFAPVALGPTTQSAGGTALRPAPLAGRLVASAVRAGTAVTRWFQAGQLTGGSSTELARWSGARR
jgi:hypothetical protein